MVGLKRLLESGSNAAQLEKRGVTVATFKEAGFTAAQLKRCFTAAQLRGAGFTAAQLKGCFTAAQLKEAGFTAAQLKEARVHVSYTFGKSPMKESVL